jgi:transposase-like protein
MLNYCIRRPAFIVDNAPWLKHALEELGLTYNTKPSDRSLVESVYSSFKRTKAFFNNIKPTNKVRGLGGQHYAGTY